MPSTIPATMRIRNISTMSPKTFQPLPRTSSRLRENDSPAERCSRTITGMITAQIVIRKRPGTMRRMSPIVIASPARMPATATGDEVLAGAREGLADARVRAAVADVGDRLDERALQPEEADDGDEEAERARRATRARSSSSAASRPRIA